MSELITMMRYTNSRILYFSLDGGRLSLWTQVTEALKYVRKALQRRSDDLHALHLLALLLSSQKQYDDAYRLIDATLTEYPDNFRYPVH